MIFNLMFSVGVEMSTLRAISLVVKSEPFGSTHEYLSTCLAWAGMGQAFRKVRCHKVIKLRRKKGVVKSRKAHG